MKTKSENSNVRSPSAHHEGEVTALRQKWINSIDIPDRAELLFQIEALLTSVDRFCRPGELVMLSSGRNKGGFSAELRLAVRTIQKSLNLCRQLLDNRDTSAILFDRFIEESLLQDGSRDHYWFLRYEQESPLDSFSLLDGTLEHLVYIGNALLQGQYIGAPVFRSFAVLLKNALYANRFFNPFEVRGFSELFDRIDHPLILRTLDQVEDEAIRRAAALIIVSALRLLRYLKMIQPQSLQFQKLQDALVVFALLRSDLAAIVPVFEKRIPQILEESGDKALADQVAGLADSLAFQFGLEGHKVFDQVLLRATEHGSRENLLNVVETAHGILANFVQQSVVAVIQVLSPDVKGRDVFQDFVSRLEQSIRLREDVWILLQLVRSAAKQLSEAPLGAEPYFSGLADYLDYFQSFAMKNIRAGDMPGFQACCNSLRAARTGDLTRPEICTRLSQELNRYEVFLDTIMQQVSQRVDLQDVPFDEVHAREIICQFQPGEQET